MSHRIFVNTQNETYRKIISNAMGPFMGLGIPTTLSDDERIELKQLAYEIYFSADELREKQRKIQIVFDSLTDPKFFGDGAVKIDKVQKYIGELETELQAQRAGVGSAVFAGAEVLTNVFGTAATIFTGAAAGGAVAAGTGAVAAVGTGALAAFPVALAVLSLSAVFSGIASTRQAGREDNAAPWKMTRADFPNITGQAIQNSPTRRSIERLYDDRSGRIRNISTQEAIALLIRETLADALFCVSNPSGTATTSPEHPGPGGNGDRNKWISKDALKRHFPFKEETTGTDKLERTYVNALLYLKNYIDLIDNILNLQQQTLSRSPDIDSALISIPITINLQTVNVRLFDALAATARQVVREKVLTFFDENREYKTLLNFGNDRQYVAEAWRISPSTPDAVQLKLLRPLEEDITQETPAFISREIAKSVIDTIEFEFAPEKDTTPYLRPFNMDGKNYVDSKMNATNVTLSSLGFVTASTGITDGLYVSYEDPVFRRWFTGDFKSSELNIDFTDYNNFIQFGSAYKRLEAFSQKLKNIDKLTSESLSPGTSGSAISALLKAREKEEIIRNFDSYEQFLYYADPYESPYSASAFYQDNNLEYNVTGSWPKQIDGTPFSPYSSVADSWLSNQLEIAQRYDENNNNYLKLNLPRYIQEDEDSTDFLNLFDMVGHLMDNIKVYVDQFPYIYSTNIDPLKELSMDQTYEVAKSFGLKLPNVYALESLQTFNTQFAGESGSRSYVAETWKRFLHSIVYFAKTKGSRTTLDALLSTYGISSPVLQIKETTYPFTGNYIKSDELTYGLRFNSTANNNVKIPFVSSSITASTIQVLFNPILRKQSSILTASSWAIDLVPHPSSSKTDYGKINVVSGSSRTVIASSSYFPLFSEDYTNLMLRSQSQDITIIQTDGDQILYQSSVPVNLSSSVWNETTFVYLGGTGSLNFDGIVDEVRVWGENISTDDFIAQAYDPGSYYGENYTSSYANLYIHLPFSQPLLSITSSVQNESPYRNVSIVSVLTASGFTTQSFSRILRTIKQYTPIAGSTIYTNKKITVAPPPEFSSEFVEDNGTKLLSRITSIKVVEDKLYNSGQNIVSFAISPTDFINQNIIRSMGVIEVNNIIGSPRYITGSGYSSLQSIQKNYIRYFNKPVQTNQYIRFFKDLVQGPSEMVDDMTPARAKLLEGIVIESPVLYRNKDNTIRSLAVDGTATKKFNNYIAGSGSIGIGAYDFNQQVEDLSVLPISLGDTLPLLATIAVSGSIQLKSSTKSSKLPFAQKVIQQVNNGTTKISGPYQLATSSIMDTNSSFVTLEAPGIDTNPISDVYYSGFARNAYYGIPASASIPARIPSEENTTVPFYDILPRADLADVGTTTYFHKSDGIYSYDIYTKYKTPYLVRLDTTATSILDRLLAKVSLLSPSSSINYPGRKYTTIPTKTYSAGGYDEGVVTIDNIFSLFSIKTAQNLRIRLYRTPQDREADASRPFIVSPTVTANVLFDGIVTNDLVYPYLLVQTTDGLLYYRIDNTTGGDITSNIVMSYFTFEPITFIPAGYLPRHYKFSRDNGIAIKRRNYLGCRDVGITFDKQSPVTVKISTSNTIIVNQNQAPAAGTGTVNIPEESSGITFGGGGTLDVTS